MSKLLFTETVLKFIWKQRRTQVAKATPSKKYNAGAITILNFKLQHRAIVMGAEWHWLKKKNKQQTKPLVDQQNRKILT